ncbi:MAG: flagellar basal body P-ring formation chaperone FlgA [Helicobacteraceae bacterium]|jgi:flagella basal body P-ring formation protein FlgA|nr:flagellar basal body P-ring formation chaperone FlgA [Helicobacteraceae bacterium]
MKRLSIVLALSAALFAKTYVLEDSYMIDGDTIRASHIVGIEKEQDFVIDRFNNKNAVQFPFNKLKRIFDERNISIDSQAAIVTFYYSSSVDYEIIKERVKERFIDAYPTIIINEINVKPLSFSDIGALEIVQIDISQNALRGNKGSLTVWFGSENSKAKRAFFSFEIDANFRVLQATKQIARGTILTQDNVKEILIAFDRVGSSPIDKSSLGKIAAKNRLNKGDMITERSIALIPDVRKNAQIATELVRNGIKISFIGIVQKDADIGELVTIKDQNKRVFTARIISKELARIE